MVRIVPRNDPESAVLSYMEREKPLKSVLQGYANRNAKKTMQKVTSLLERMGYDGKNANTVLIRQADPKTIRDLEEIAERLPAKERKQILSKMYGQIGTGTLTVKRAVNDLLKYGPLQDADKMYADANNVLRKTAKEGMLRGEFMVQKSLGVGWQTETPNIKGVDAFLHKRWDERDATDYLKPMGQIMKDQVTESIFLGESPQKMSQRMQRVEEISKVRADRNARTITTAVANEAQMDSYKKDGVKQYQWVATFDERTCPACGQKDGKKYPMGNGDYPPLHPNCRCTTIAVLNKSIQDRLNANLALHRDDYKAKYVSPDTTFDEWKKNNVTNKPTKNPLKEPTKREKQAYEYAPETVAGVKQGEPMQIEQADGGNSNPHYNDGPQYRVNCTDCVMAYEMRRRGYDVEAKGYDDNDQVFKEYRAKTWEAWEDDDGNLAHYTYGMDATTPTKALKWMDENIQDNERHHIIVNWKGRNAGGHIMSAEKADGKMIVVDPQTGQIYDGKRFKEEILERVNLTKGRVFMFRVDDKKVKTSVADTVLQSKEGQT